MVSFVPRVLKLRLTVISRRLQLEWDLERQLLLRDSLDINVPDRARLGRDSSELDTVDQWLLERDVFDARVVESVDVVPV